MERKTYCHFCRQDLFDGNNAMIRCMNGQEPAPRGFGWISVIVAPFKEVPCCDICMEKDAVNDTILMK